MDGISTLSATVEFQPAYTVMVLLGLAVALAFPVTKGIPSDERRQYYIIQVITLTGALFGAKLAVLMGDALWPIEYFDDWPTLVFSGRSLIGALVLGFIFAELAKPLMRYRLPPNDRFAVVLPFSIGIGRIGCHLAGCCCGLPHDGLFAVSYGDGVVRHAIALYEMSFHFAAGLALLALYRRQLLTGRLFALYLAAYGLFRFLTENLRLTEKVFAGFSAYQWFALTALGMGLAVLWLRTHSAPPAFRHTRVEA